MPPDAFPDPRSFRYPEWVSIGSYLYRSGDVIAFGTPLTVENVRTYGGMTLEFLKPKRSV